MAIWRNLTTSDIGPVMRVGDAVHPGLPESAQVFAKRLKLYLEGCLALEEDGQVCGYAISHPIRKYQSPALDSLLGEIPSDADCYYIHDVVILPALRGRGLAACCIAGLLEVAQRFSVACLVSVYGTEPFWARFGFVREPVGEDLREKLREYGEDAVFLSE
ncbi:acyl-CoA N-acyltransferase [Aspergillus aurantiobrunneus]